MKVKELIEILQTVDPDLPVYAQESGGTGDTEVSGLEVVPEIFSGCYNLKITACRLV